MCKHVLSIYLEQNNFWKQATFKNVGGSFLLYFSNFRATFGVLTSNFSWIY